MFSAGGLGLHALLCNSANQALKLYWCYLPELTASTTRHFLAPLTSLPYQFLKNAQLGANQENTLTSQPQEILCEFWGKLSGSQRTAKGLDHLPTKQFVEQKDKAEHWGTSALLPERRVCGKPARLQEGQSREHGCQGRAGCAAPFPTRATDGLLPWEGASPSL